MNEVVHASTEALESLRDGLGRLAVDLSGAAADVDAILRRTHSDCTAVVTRRRAEVNRLAGELDRCRSSPPPPRGCAPIATALADAQRKLADAQRAVRTIEQAMHTHAAASARVLRETQALTSQGRNIVARSLGELAMYLAAGSPVNFGTTSASESFAGTARALGGLALTGEADGMPDGYRSVPLNLVDDSDSGVHGPEDFKKPGYTPEDLAWSYQALREVVLPALARGLGKDHLAELDAERGFMGTHSYTECYNGFFSPDEAIRLHNLPGGRYGVENGFHRIWVARGLGLDTIPAMLASNDGWAKS